MSTGLTAESNGLSYQDGDLICKFTRQKNVTSNNQIFDLGGQRYYVLLGYGSTAGNGKYLAIIYLD